MVPEPALPRSRPDPGGPVVAGAGLADGAVCGAAAADEATGWALSARSGDPAAVAAFVRATQVEVWRFCASVVDTDTADDLTQETYLRALRALPAFEGRSSARTWLFGIARRTCADHLRTTVRRRTLLRRVGASATEESGGDPSEAVGAVELLRRLNPAQREAFVLTQVLGLSYEEAAAAAGVPIGTIRSRVARARMELVAAVADAWSA